jgi:hypothetical protein
MKDSFRVFDGFIVVVSTIEIIVNYMEGSSGSALSAFRAFRLLRVFRLASSWKSLHSLLKTIQ